MTQRKIRVLLDLNLALRGYSGIPQDTRLLYKTLAKCPEIEVTGLLYPTFQSVLQHKFARAGAPRGDRLANQGCLLWGIGDLPKVSTSRSVRVLSRIWRQIAMRTTRRGQLDVLDSEAFSHVLWRTVFAQSLAAEDLPLVEQGKFLLLNTPAELMHKRVLAKLTPIKIDTRGYDFIIVQTARPMRVSPGTKHLVRYHDMIPMLQTDTTGRMQDVRAHFQSIRQSADSVFVCNSQPTQDNLVDVFPEFRDRSATVPYMLSDAYRPEDGDRPEASQISSIIRTRRSAATGAAPRKPLRKIPRYIMGVSTLEPRKNFQGLIQAYNAVRFRKSMARAVPDLKLLIVGSPGWRYKPILGAMREQVASGDIIHLESVTSDELRMLYSQAEALVYPSHAEGFGFPPLEAMQCDLPVIASDIPEHRWVLGDSALFCNSYDVSSIADAIERMLASEDSPALKRELIARGRRRIERYTQERCGEQWLELLQRLHAGQPPMSDEAPATTRFTRDPKDWAA